ncbi:MAG: 6-pyruvoyltetrahydropterin synthase [Cenarchaeum symbiont of Oopsacas minuta]|nr:6-pyruvoyltetrahydropterin synthase [Cenarchaeum symbiont of Oopsacas minuta]
MTAESKIVSSDRRYLDKHDNLLNTRTELAVAQMLEFLGHKYEYGHKENIDGTEFIVDFKTEKGLIEVIDGNADIEKYKKIKETCPGVKIMGIGHPKYASQLKELDDVVFYDQKHQQTGSIFLEDQSFTFDYSHILPLVEKCSILHGHTSAVMVELAGEMKNNLLLDFDEAKRIIKDVMHVFDHKFFINKKYVQNETDDMYEIKFDGPKGSFDLKIPKHNTYILNGEATVENLSTEIIHMLSPKLPPNVDAVGVYIYEGYNKGSHIISSLMRA